MMYNRGKPAFALLLCLLLPAMIFFSQANRLIPKQDTQHETNDAAALPVWNGDPVFTYSESPVFDAAEISTSSYINFSDLDDLGRCGTALACIGPESLPVEERTSISMVKPSGWQTGRYDFIDNGGFLFNRCHLIAWMLCGINDDPRNLITGTRYLNTEGMLPYEQQVASYIRKTGHHVMYRITPVFVEDELLSRGVRMEAMSVEDSGLGLSFHVYCFNVQPGVTIDYANGNHHLADTPEPATVITDPSPVLFGSFHLQALLCSVILPFGAAYILRKKDESYLIRVLFLTGCLLAVLEAGKQWYSFTVVHGNRFDTWIFPFQLCSVPMYLCLLLPVIKNRTKDTVLVYLWDFVFFGAFLALLYPEGFLSAPLLLRLHGFLWHAMLLFIAFVIFFSGIAGKYPHGFFRACTLFFTGCLIAILLNLFLEGRGLPGSYPDMFYLTPFRQTTQPVVRDIEASYGRPAARFLYIAALVLLGALDHLLYRAFSGKRVCDSP